MIASPPQHSADERHAFGVYVHWPFCVSKCPYCDFNSHVAAGAVDGGLWADALVREFETLLVQQETLGAITSIFFGGGTPSLMPPSSVAAILDAIGKHRPLPADVEITLEANPESASLASLQGFRAAGVNRLSLGVQSLDDASLRALGRPHDTATALSAIAAARKCFQRVSFDLIYGRPQQSDSLWRRELSRALGQDVGHLSLYQLTIEPNTPYARWHSRGKLPLPDEETLLAQMQLARECCADAGLPHYEISNHARPGEECRHNLLYWRYGFYLGIGPGAHGRLPGADKESGERIATEALADPARWLQQVRQCGQGLAQRHSLTPAQQAEERLLSGLRLREGMDMADFPSQTSEKRDDLVTQGLLWHKGERIGCTPRGERLLNHVLEQLLA